MKPSLTVLMYVASVSLMSLPDPTFAQLAKVKRGERSAESRTAVADGAWHSFSGARGKPATSTAASGSVSPTTPDGVWHFFSSRSAASVYKEGLAGRPGQSASSNAGGWDSQDPQASTNNVENTAATVRLYLNDGTSYPVQDCWMAYGKVHYSFSDGAESAVDIDQLDLPRTLDKNFQRLCTVREPEARNPTTVPGPPL